MSVQEAAQFRQKFADLQKALIREQFERRELENRIRKLEARLGAIETAPVARKAVAA